MKLVIDELAAAWADPEAHNDTIERLNAELAQGAGGDITARVLRLAVVFSMVDDEDVPPSTVRLRAALRDLVEAPDLGLSVKDRNLVLRYT